MRPAEPEVWSLRLSSSSSTSLSLSLPLFSGFSFVGSLLFLSADYGSWERPNDVFFFIKGFLKRAPWKRQPGPFISLIPPNDTGACHCLPFFTQHATQPVIISSIPLSLSFSFSSLSLSHVLKAFLPLLTFLSSLKSFLLSACHLLFHLFFPRLLTPSLLFHALCRMSWLFFFLFSLCVFLPTRLSLSCYRRLYFFAIYCSLGSLSVGIAAATKQTVLPICRRNKRGFCCLFLEDDLKPPS